MPPKFLSLPLELRWVIYDMAVAEPTVVINLEAKANTAATAAAKEWCTSIYEELKAQKHVISLLYVSKETRLAVQETIYKRMGMRWNNTISYNETDMLTDIDLIWPLLQGEIRGARKLMNGIGGRIALPDTIKPAWKHISQSGTW